MVTRVGLGKQSITSCSCPFSSLVEYILLAKFKLRWVIPSYQQGMMFQATVNDRNCRKHEAILFSASPPVPAPSPPKRAATSTVGDTT